MDREGPGSGRGPRTIGEIIERAFALYGRSALSCIIATFVSTLPTYALFQSASQLKSLPAATAMPLQQANAIVVPAGFWTIVLVWAIVNVACGMILTHVLAAAHTGARLEPLRIVQRIAKRFFPTLAMLFGVYIATISIVFCACVVVSFTYVTLAMGLHAAAAGLGLAVLEGMVALMYVLPIWILVTQLVWVTYTLSSPAFAGGLRPILRVVFSELTRRRSFFFGLALLAVPLGTSVVAGAIFEITLLASKLTTLATVLQMLVQSLATPVVFGMAVIFAIDSNLLIAPQPEIELADETALLTE